MRETERQKTERLLREQLARFQQEGSGESRRYAMPFGAADERIMLAGLGLLPVSRWRQTVGAFIAVPLQGMRPARWGKAAVAALRGRSRRHPVERKTGQASDSRGVMDTTAAERAFDDLYDAALSDPPRAASGEGNDGRRAPWRRRPAPPPASDLPKISGRGARLAVMRETPARDWGPPPKVQFPKPDKKKDRRSDLVVAALGIVLGLTCALFPWYIFFNQEQFGVQAISLGGRGPNAGRIMVDPRPGEDIADVARQDISKNLDLFSTGTVPARPETPEEAPGVDQQPFPAEAAEFRLVHVANGRAMIEDDAGLWIVQQGSNLPDQTRVKSIEKRNGRWVLVTSADRVVEISQ